MSARVGPAMDCLGFSAFLGLIQVRGRKKTAAMTFTAPVFSVGWIVALVLLIAALMLWGLGALPKEAALLICAVCAVRL